MPPAERHLRLVPPGTSGATPVSNELSDIGLTLTIFLVAALPLGSAMVGRGGWGNGSLGLATVGVLLTGRELCLRAAGEWRRRRAAGLTRRSG